MDLATYALVTRKFVSNLGAAVNDWLTAHPEATTTVQDGAITPEKLAPSLSATSADIAGIISIIEGGE